jgi:endo-1,4-beta-xylanase
VEDPLHPGQLLGAFEFLSRFERNTSPDTVVYKSYMDIHRKAYWTVIDISTLWQNKPGAIRARRDPQANSLKIELARVTTATIDIQAAKLSLAPGRALTVRVSRLDEPVFDPALESADEPLTPRLILRGDFSSLEELQVRRDGGSLSDAEFVLVQDRITIGPFRVEKAVLLELRARHAEGFDKLKPVAEEAPTPAAKDSKGEDPVPRELVLLEPDPAKKLPNRNIDKLEKAWIDPDTTAPPLTHYKSFPSKMIKGEVSYLIYLPPGYEKDVEKRYPVVYWLHGTGGKQSRGAGLAMKLDENIRSGQAPPMILVLVNGLRGATLYCDSKDGQWPLESVIINDMIRHIDTTYRTVAGREGRAIEGFSMGGFGAGHLGFKYPDIFGVVSILDPALLTGLDPSNNPHPTWQGQVGYALGGDVELYQANNPFHLLVKNADKLRGRTRIRLVPHAAGGDLFFLAKCDEMHALLDKCQIAHVYDPRKDVNVHNYSVLYDTMGEKGFGFYAEAFAKVKGDSKP